MDCFKQLSLFDLMAQEAPEDEVVIEGAVNLNAHPISDYKVKLAYGDLVLIISMLRDYVKGFDAMAAEGILPINENHYNAYYRVKFMGMATKISEQIEYDYDKKMAQCLKKMSKEDNSDIGDEAMSLMIKKAQREAAAKQEEEGT